MGIGVKTSGAQMQMGHALEVPHFASASVEWWRKCRRLRELRPLSVTIRNQATSKMVNSLATIKRGPLGTSGVRYLDSQVALGALA